MTMNKKMIAENMWCQLPVIAALIVTGSEEEIQITDAVEIARGLIDESVHVLEEQL